MDEVSEQNSNEAVAPQETETTQEIQAEVKQPEEVKDPHWLKNLRKERQELAQKNRMLEQLLAQQMQVKQQPVAQEEDFIDQLQKEEYVPGEKVAKGFKHLEAKFAKQLAEVENKYKASAYNAQINELKRDYTDLEDIVNPETLQIVKEKNPRLAQTWAGLDDYTLYVQAYPYIKHSGIMEDVPGFKRAKEVDKKLEQNKKTVPSPASFDKRPMAQAFDPNRLSKSQKDELQKEMQHFASLGGGSY